jgi:hypothetical protein
MATVAIPGFIGPAYESRSKAIDCQQCVNLYPEVENSNSKNVIALIGTPGKTKWSTYPAYGNCRGIYTTTTGKLYAVFGLNVYEYSTAGAQTLVGSLLTTTGAVRMVDNGPANVFGGDQLFIADGTYGYIVTMSTNAFQQITHVSFPGSLDVEFKDSYFVVIQPNTQTVWQSTQFNGLIWDGSKFADAYNKGDNLVRIVRQNNELLLFGKQSIEIWYNVGSSSGITFSPVANTQINFGTDAPGSVATMGNECLFLGSDSTGHGIVWRMVGYVPTRISTHAIEYQIGQFSRIDDALAYCYQEEGHFFYVLNFPTGQRCFVYDLTTGLWHERASYKRASGKNGRYRNTCYTYFDGKHITGDYYGDGYLYELSLDANDEDGEPIVSIRSCPHIHKNMKRLYFNKIEIDMERGVGTENGLGENPQAMLQLSRDGGKVWSAEKWRDIGKQGEYLTRMNWQSLGCSRDTVIRLTISDPARRRIINAFADIEVEID